MKIQGKDTDIDVFMMHLSEYFVHSLSSGCGKGYNHNKMCTKSLIQDSGIWSICHPPDS